MRLLFFCFILFSSPAVYSQNSDDVMRLIQIAKDSINLNKFEGASRILEGISVYGLLDDSIVQVKNQMKEKCVAVSYECYKKRAFDLSLKYYQEVFGEDSINENHYWIKIAHNLRFYERVLGVVILGVELQCLNSSIAETVHRKIRKDQYEKFLEDVLEYNTSVKPYKYGVDFLIPVQDKDTKKWGFQDSHEVLLIPCEYDELLTEFKPVGIAVIKKDGIYGYLHVSGVSTHNANDLTTWEGGMDAVNANPTIENRTMKEILEYLQKSVVR